MGSVDGKVATENMIDSIVLDACAVKPILHAGYSAEVVCLPTLMLFREPMPPNRENSQNAVMICHVASISSKGPLLLGSDRLVATTTIATTVA